jgi:hypothetical protein
VLLLVVPGWGARFPRARPEPRLVPKAGVAEAATSAVVGATGTSGAEGALVAAGAAGAVPDVSVSDLRYVGYVC